MYDAEYDTARSRFDGQWHGRYLIRNRNSDGNLYVRYLYWNDGRWNWNCLPLGRDWGAANFSGSLATLLISPLLLVRGVLFGLNIVESFCQHSTPTTKHSRET